jgi:two-component system, sensor histidine kinase and response regulator
MIHPRDPIIDEPHASRATILIVDDQPENLKVLSKILQPHYLVRVARSGEHALRAAGTDPTPDLMLLDIMMPGMDGFEVCRRLKDNKKFAEIPVIFLSALNEAEDKVKAFAAGGVDYITKPFQAAEVAARVRIHLKLQTLKRRLVDHNENLKQLVAERTRELEQAHGQLKRLDRTKSDFLNMISHEMRTPLNGILGIGSLAFEMLPETPDRNEMLNIYEHSRDRMIRLLEDAETLIAIEATLEQGGLDDVPIFKTFREAKNEISGLKVLEDLPDDFAAVRVLSEFVLLKRALGTLMKTAGYFVGARDTLHVTATVSQQAIQLDFALNNLAINNEQAASFFDIVSSARSQSFAEPLGLAPVVAHRIIALFGGGVHLIKNGPSEGILRVVLVPAL